MSTRTRTLVTVVTVALAALAALPACTLATVDAEVDSVCLTYTKAQDAAPLASGVLIKNFTFDELSAFHELLDNDAEVSFAHATVSASTDDALSGIESATVNISTASLPSMTVYACQDNCLSTDGGSLELPGDATADAVAYLGGDTLDVELSATGSLPMQAWTMRVDVCMSGHAHYAYKP